MRCAASRVRILFPSLARSIDHVSAIATINVTSNKSRIEKL
jgi:hypothetical protein